MAAALRAWSAEIEGTAHEGRGAIARWVALKWRLHRLVMDTSLPIGQHELRRRRDRASLANAIAAVPLDTPQDRTRLAALQSRLDEATSSFHRSQRMAYSTRLELDMWRPTSWLVSAASSRSFAPMPDLDDNGARVAGDTRKLELIHAFYSALYTPDNSHDAHEEQDAADALLAGLPRIGAAAAAALAAPITADEIHMATRRARLASAPGLDGLPFQVYKLCPPLAPALAACANEMMAEHEPPAVMDNTLRGVLLPKKGDLGQLANYRPLSVANADVRLVSNAMSARLQDHLTSCIAPAQTGFIAGRNAAHGAVALHLVVDAVNAGLIPGGSVFLVSIDQQKAYDRVRHDWLLDCLQRFGAPPAVLRYYRRALAGEVQFIVEGARSAPVVRRCGLPQGAPDSCLLFALSLEPFLHALRANTGVSLPFGRHRGVQPLRISDVTFADDVNVLLQGSSQLEHFLTVQHRYELAANSQVSTTKSWAWRLSPDSSGAPTADDIAFDSIPFPRLGGADGDFRELRHVGFPIHSQGKVPSIALTERLASLACRIGQLAQHRTTLDGRVNISNSLLLGRLWHATQLCPLAVRFSERVYDTLAPYLFKGYRRWIAKRFVHLPRALGGFGLINCHHMTVSMCGRVVAQLLHLSTTGPDTSPEHALGHQFAAALHDEMLRRDLLPARFLLRTGRPWRRLNQFASSTFLGRCLYVLKTLQLDVEVDWTTITLEEVLALPWMHPLWRFEWPRVMYSPTYASYRSVAQFLTIADVLWFRRPEEGGYGNWRLWHFYSLPITPPSPRGIDFHGAHLRVPPAVFKLAAGTLTKRYWSAFWLALPTRVRDLLTAYVASGAQPVPDRAAGHDGVRSHDRPMAGLDARNFDFPWRFARLAGRPLDSYTVTTARTFLQRDADVAEPDWPAPPLPREALTRSWSAAWAMLHSLRSVHTSAVASHARLFMHWRMWIAQVHRRRPGERAPDPDSDIEADAADDDGASDTSERDVQEALAAGLELDTELAAADDAAGLEQHLEPLPDEQRDTPAPGPLAHARAVGDDDDDAGLRRDYVLGRCPSCPSPDSVAHGYLQCPVVWERVWQPCLELLPLLHGRLRGKLATRVLDGFSAPFDMVRYWPARHFATPDAEALRSRLALWRDVVIAHIADARHAAIAASAHGSQRVLASYGDAAAAVTRKLTACLSAARARASVSAAATAAFDRRWIDNGSLLEP
jgi:hypothetical protein